MRIPHGRGLAPTLRHKFLLTTLIGAVLPLGLLGVWLLQTAANAGGELLGQQLEESLDQLAGQIDARWEHRRSDLLLLAENEVVRQGMLDGRSTESPSDPVMRYLEGAYARVQHLIDRVRYRDAEGNVRWELTPDAAQVLQLERSDPSSAPVSPASAGVTITIPILDSSSGRGLGSFEARVRLAGILPAGAEQAGPSGAVLTVLHSGSLAPLLTSAFEPAALVGARFEHGGQVWLARRRTLRDPPVTLVLAAPLEPYTRPFARQARRGAIALFAVALSGFGMAALLTRRLTRSLEHLATAATAVSAGDLDRRVDADTGDEIGQVAKAFNTMTESLRRTLADLSQRESLAAVGEFAASLAHEVRNPLTAIRIDLQRVHEKMPPEGARLRDPLARALRSVERLDRTVSGSLRIARSGSVKLEPVDLRAVLDAAMHSARPEFEARRVILTEPSHDGASPSVRGDPAALGQLFLNLLLNAAQALEPGGSAGVHVMRHEDSVVVVVRDSGRGMTPEQVARAFEPFYSTRTDGTGLGLAVAQRIASAHGGAIEIESELGIGTRVRVRLPAIDPVRHAV